MCRKLKREEIMFSTWMRNGLVFVKVKEGDKPNQTYGWIITAYPDFDFSFRLGFFLIFYFV